MQFTVTWYNPQKHLYDNYYIPSDYLKEYECRLTSNFNYSNYIDTKLSLSQLHSYIKGYDLVDNIFNEEVSNWIKNSNKVINFSKYKYLVNKVQIC